MLAVECAVLVPMKSFDNAKARLSGVLSPHLRGMFARWMADQVFNSARPLPLYVVCDDEEVAHFADTRACTVLWKPGLGLNAAVQAAVDDLALLGHDHVVVAHGDLPRAKDMQPLAEDGVITLVPDLRNDGTNVISLPVGTSFEFSYGPRSFARHLATARSTGRAISVRHHPLFAHDVDTPDDLAHPLVQEVLPPWMPTNRVSRPPAFPWAPPEWAEG
jgi:2-phospho-L-lactate guanylyltransferase